MGQAHVWRGLGAGLGGFGWCERRIEVRFVWARRMFGAGLARVWRGFGWCGVMRLGQCPVLAMPSSLANAAERRARIHARWVTRLKLIVFCLAVRRHPGL